MKNRTLETRIPPPVLALAIVGAMSIVARLTPVVPLDFHWRLVASALLMIVALAFGLLAMNAFRRARTTINPVEPEAASAVVTGGIFRLTRNPMYVSLTALLLAWAVYLSAPWGVVGPVFFALFITRFQIIPEERALRQKFGAAYADYQQRVRRWL